MSVVTNKLRERVGKLSANLTVSNFNDCEQAEFRISHKQINDEIMKHQPVHAVPKLREKLPGKLLCRDRACRRLAGMSDRGPVSSRY